jgi:hypothetical protein
VNVLAVQLSTGAVSPKVPSATALLRVALALWAEMTFSRSSRHADSVFSSISTLSAGGVSAGSIFSRGLMSGCSRIRSVVVLPRTAAGKADDRAKRASGARMGSRK